MATENTAPVVQLKSPEGTPVYPVSSTEAFYDKAGAKVPLLMSYKVIGTDETVPELNTGATHTHDASQITTGVLGMEHGGLGATTPTAARTALETCKPVSAEVTFTSAGWTTSGSNKIQTVNCSVASATTKLGPFVGLKLSTDASAAKLEQTAYGCISYFEATDGSLQAVCLGEAPQVNVTVIYTGGV